MPCAVRRSVTGRRLLATTIRPAAGSPTSAGYRSGPQASSKRSGGVSALALRSRTLRRRCISLRIGVDLDLSRALPDLGGLSPHPVEQLVVAARLEREIALAQ